MARRTAPPIDPACTRALQYEDQAWSQENAGSSLAAYNTAVGGLAASRECSDPPSRLIAEAFLYGVRAAAEFDLRIGDWRSDLGRSDDLLRRCTVAPGLRGRTGESQCRTQLRNNEAARVRMNQTSAVPIIPLRVTIARNSSSVAPSVAAGRSGITM